MNRFYLPLVLFLVMVLEGVALELLPVNITSGKSLIISHWVLICLVFSAIFYDDEESNYSLIYAIIFGLLIDVVYIHVLGVYMFTYAITIYIIKKLTRLLHSNLASTLLCGILGIILADWFIYIIFTMIGYTDLSLGDYLIYRLLPTMLANIIFLILIYPILSKKFSQWQVGYSS